MNAQTIVAICHELDLAVFFCGATATISHNVDGKRVALGRLEQNTGAWFAPERNGRSEHIGTARALRTWLSRRKTLAAARAKTVAELTNFKGAA